MKPFTTPNFFSMLRLLLVPFFFLSMYYYLIGTEMLIWIARVLFCIIVISDFLDGYLARRLHQVSTLGSVLDPVADKLFVTASFVLLTVFDKISAWLTITVVAKDILVSIGWCMMVMLYDRVDVNPSLLGKGATCLQFFTILVVVMFPMSYHNLWLEFLTAAVTMLALVHYAYQALLIAGGSNGNAN